MCFTSLSRAKPNAIISTSGGKSMKRSVSGSRTTTVDSFNRMALKPRNNALSMGHLFFVRLLFISASGHSNKYVFQRRRDRPHIDIMNTAGGEKIHDGLFRNGLVHEQ